jgi:ribosomal protein S8
VARFPSMIGIMRACLKTGTKFCDVPVNSLCLDVLRILRQHGYIQGFHYTSPRKLHARLFPRVKIFFKYADHKSPTVKHIKAFKNARSNWRPVTTNKHIPFFGTSSKMYLISTTTGLCLTSHHNIYTHKLISRNFSLRGKMLLELII